VLQDKLVILRVTLILRLLRGRREEKEREEKNNKKHLAGVTVDFHI
jgi:hypothetical protein